MKHRFYHIKNAILVMSGKGDVGKSSSAAYLSIALAKRDYRVGPMDVDLHGHSIPRLTGLKGLLERGLDTGKVRPVQYMQNMEVVLIEVLIGKDKNTAAIWREPIKIGVIRQCLSYLEWGELYYLIIESPPGTEDEPLTVGQTIPDAKALIVTTPQEISLADVRKSINFCRQVNMKILGVVLNMSGLKCPYCGKIIDIFKTKEGMFTAENESSRLLGTLPFEPEVVKEEDGGDISYLDNNNLLITQKYNKMVDEIVGLYE